MSKIKLPIEKKRFSLARNRQTNKIGIAYFAHKVLHFFTRMLHIVFDGIA